MRFAIVPLLLLSPALACALVGCASDSEIRESADVAAANLGMAVTVQSNGNTAVVELELSTADYYPLQISPQEGLVLDAPGAPTTAFAVLGDRAFITIATTGSTFFLRHTRPDGGRTRTLELPPAFVVEAPEKASRAEPITLRWTPNEDEPVAIVATSSCFTGSVARRLERDRGEYTFSVGDFRIAGTLDCRLVFRVTRTLATRDGRDSVTAHQIRTVTVESTP